MNSARLRTWLPIIGVGVVAAALYAATLMTAVGSCEHAYCADVGEFQIALAVWGTVHHTGYPLYMLLGSPFVTLLHWMGLPPAAGASVYSLVWEVLAVMGFALIVRRLTQSAWLAVGASLIVAVLRPIWIHGSIPEVYSLSMALSVAIVWVTLDLREQWSDTKGWLLALLGGLGVAHHRLIAILLVPVGLFLLPAAWRSKNFWRWLALSASCFFAGFLPYLDMPLRVWLGSKWNYGRPETWDGFWFIFWGKEVAGWQKPDFHPVAILSAAQEAWQVLHAEFTLPGLIVIAAGSVVALIQRRTRSIAAFFGGLAVAYLLFTTIFFKAVLIEADLMLPLLAFVALLALGLSNWSPRGRQVTGVALCAASVFLAARNYPGLYALTHTPDATNYTRLVEQLEAPPGAVVMAPWGARFFALRYAQLVDGHMPQWNIVDHRAHFGELVQATDGRVYTAADTRYVFDVDWWTQQLGGPLRVTAAGPDLVALTARPLDPAPVRVYPLADGIALARWDVRPLADGRTDISLYWTATRTPTADYSTYVHVTDQSEISAPEDLVAQDDSFAPVAGWYPTSRWQPDEVIREDHVVTLPPERPALTIFAGMYSRDAAGDFVQLGQVTLRKINEQWVVQP